MDDCADIRDKAERVAGKLDDIHFNSRSASWLDDAVAIVAAALIAERKRAYEECAGIADEHDTGKSRNDWDAGANYRAGTIALAIRARVK